MSDVAQIRLSEFTGRVEKASASLSEPYGMENFTAQALGALLQDKLFELTLLAEREKGLSDE